MLTDVWNSFIIWLLNGDNGFSEDDLKEYIQKGEKPKKFIGLKKAPSTNCHKEIVTMYKNTNAVSVTTNFDNLLSTAFEEVKHLKEEEKNTNKKVKAPNEEEKDLNIKFVPILTDEDFEKFFLENPVEGKSKMKQMIEIQSRGDVFWSRCSGENNTICPHTKTRCYIPKKDILIDEENCIRCSICGSPTDVYFAFPATKEKDTEMAKVFSMIWKYLALRCSTIIILGSSMNFDPVLMNFVLELVKRKEIAVLYVSGSNREKEITERLFCEDVGNRKWVYGSDAAYRVLYKLNHEYEKPISNNDSVSIRYNYLDYINFADSGIGVGKVDDFIEADDNSEIFQTDMLIGLKRYSQLGLKTYWLSGSEDSTANHNRYKHSINTMLIASAIYLAVKKGAANINELHFLQTASLLHDIGHLPFSHLIEEIFKEFGWIPYGEKKTFNHEFNTKSKIKSLFDNKYSNEEQPQGIVTFLRETGYTQDDLIRLIQGEFGVGYLDAIINSPIDADKIEYLFTDSEYIRQRNIQFKTFIEDFTSDIYCNENKFMVLSNKSTQRMLDLIKMRSDMYNKIYLRPGLRYLESCCKLIIRTYIAHMLCDDEFNEFAKKEVKKGESQNLSTIKIKYVTEWIEKKINSRPKSALNRVCELYLIEEMIEQLRKNDFLSKDIKKAVNFCYEKIIGTTSEKKVNKIENNYIISIEIPKNKVSSEKIHNLIKTVNLRFPGIIILDYVESKVAFSFSDSGIPQKRSDKTYQRCENILIKDINVDYNASKSHDTYCFGDATDLITNKLGLTTNSIINIYKICDESYNYYTARDYVFNELRELGLNIVGTIK